MKTRFLSYSPQAVVLAAQTLQNGGLCALPTETVYGLGANGFDATAVSKIFTAKGRPQDNPLILHIAEWSMLEQLTSDIPSAAYTLANAFWPGPLTMIFKRSAAVPDAVTAGLDTVAIRMPSSLVMQEVIRTANLPIAAPSANRSGKPSPTTAQHVLDDLDGRIDLIIDGGACEIGVESTIVLLGSTPTLLRPGGVTLEQLQSVLGTIAVDPTLYGAQTTTPLAPGMKYRHYAPNGSISVIRGTREQVINYIQNAVASCSEKTGILAPDGYFTKTDADLVLSLGNSSATAANRLFSCLRAFDDAHITKIFAIDTPDTGMGLALCNRLYKAAGFQIIRL